MKSRSKISWNLSDWFNKDKTFIRRYHTTKVFGVGVNDMDVQIKPLDSVSNPIYTKWQRMLERSYCSKYKNKFPTYMNVSVCERWLTFSHFREDYLNLVSGIEGRENFILDKDLLVKGNRLYSLETCSLLPAKVNSFLTSCNTRRGELPRGVSKRSKGYKFMVTLSYNGLNRNLGDFNTPEEAFLVYKNAKEAAARVLAEENRSLLLPNEFNALYNFSVEITD